MAAGVHVDLPYCGRPPTPDQIWARWNVDPVLIALLVAAAVTYLAAVHASHRSGRRVPGTQILAFAAGWIVLVVSLVSPLCALSVALSSGRIGQHMVLSLVAAPLLVLGRPGRLLPIDVIGRFGAAISLPPVSLVGSAPVATTLYAICLWTWHLPSIYASTFASDVLYWAMHVSMLGSALLLWQSLLVTDGERRLLGLFWGFATAMQMSLLGALLTLTPRPWFSVHASTTSAWGFTPLEDQQLGGLFMWVPGGVLLLLAALTSVVAIFRRLDEQHRLAGAGMLRDGAAAPG